MLMQFAHSPRHYGAGSMRYPQPLYSGQYVDPRGLVPQESSDLQHIDRQLVLIPAPSQHDNRIYHAYGPPYAPPGMIYGMEAVPIPHSFLAPRFEGAPSSLAFTGHSAHAPPPNWPPQSASFAYGPPANALPMSQQPSAAPTAACAPSSTQASSAPAPTVPRRAMTTQTPSASRPLIKASPARHVTGPTGTLRHSRRRSTPLPMEPIPEEHAVHEVEPPRVRILQRDPAAIPRAPPAAVQRPTKPEAPKARPAGPTPAVVAAVLAAAKLTAASPPPAKLASVATKPASAPPKLLDPAPGSQLIDYFAAEKPDGIAVFSKRYHRVAVSALQPPDSSVCMITAASLASGVSFSALVSAIDWTAALIRRVSENNPTFTEAVAGDGLHALHVAKNPRRIPFGDGGFDHGGDSAELVFLPPLLSQPGNPTIVSTFCAFSGIGAIDSVTQYGTGRTDMGIPVTADGEAPTLDQVADAAPKAAHLHIFSMGTRTHYLTNLRLTNSGKNCVQLFNREVAATIEASIATVTSTARRLLPLLLLAFPTTPEEALREALEKEAALIEVEDENVSGVAAATGVSRTPRAPTVVDLTTSPSSAASTTAPLTERIRENGIEIIGEAYETLLACVGILHSSVLDAQALPPSPASLYDYQVIASIVASHAPNLSFTAGSSVAALPPGQNAWLGHAKKQILVLSDLISTRNRLVEEYNANADGSPPAAQSPPAHIAATQAQKKKKKQEKAGAKLFALLLSSRRRSICSWSRPSGVALHHRRRSSQTRPGPQHP